MPGGSCLRTCCPGSSRLKIFWSTRSFLFLISTAAPSIARLPPECAWGPTHNSDLNPFLGDLDSLGINRAYRYPRTTEHLDTIIDFSRALISREFAYEKLRSVYFDLSRSESYGMLSGIDPKKVRIGKTVDLSAYEKLHPSDFALLKRATLSELKMGAFVKTDRGNVIPTWHISAASAAIHDLGPQIDIVVSSMDFLFPHLENVREIGEALTGKPFANTWMIAERVWSAERRQRGRRGGRE